MLRVSQNPVPAANGSSSDPFADELDEVGVAADGLTGSKDYGRQIERGRGGLGLQAR